MNKRIIIQVAAESGYMVMSDDGVTVLHAFGNYRELIFHLGDLLRPTEEPVTLVHDPESDAPALRSMRQPEPVTSIMGRVKKVVSGQS